MHAVKYHDADMLPMSESVVVVTGVAGVFSCHGCYL